MFVSLLYAIYTFFRLLPTVNELDMEWDDWNGTGVSFTILKRRFSHIINASPRAY